MSNVSAATTAENGKEHRYFSVWRIAVLPRLSCTPCLYLGEITRQELPG